MTKRLPIALAALALALASLALAACGGDDESSTTSAEETTAPEGGGSTVTVEADPGGALAWTETDLTAEAGAATIELVNDSETPHDVVIEGDSGELAQSETISASTTTTSAELEPGSYTFFCSVPGHQEAGMEGTLTVE